MAEVNLNWIANFIWGIADDVLRDLYVRGKCRDVILRMMVLRRPDAVLEPTKPNRKPEHRRGKVQLIDATAWFKPLRKNLGKKNCELSEEDIRRICDTFHAFEETEHSKIFPNGAFGYQKVSVERPLRVKDVDPNRAYNPREIKALKESGDRDDSARPVIGNSWRRRCLA